MKTGSNLLLLNKIFPGNPAFILFLFLFINLVLDVSAQNNEDAQKKLHFSGNILATNNGISLIPSFNLGRPAVAFNLSIGGEKLSFDPQFRFSMDGKPWSFILWWRYRFIQNEKFQFSVGAHPALSFKEMDVIYDNENMHLNRVRRYLAGELAPSFKVAKKITIAPYYLFAYGVEDDLVRNTHYIALQSSFSNIEVTDQLLFGINPQVYALIMDDLTGTYFASNFSLTVKDFPISAGLMINQKINSDIASKDFIWSLSIIYSFNNKYYKQ